MGQRKYPPLTPSEVAGILDALGFKFKRKTGSHAHYERVPCARDSQRRVVTVDEAERQFDDYLIKSMIRQSGESRKAFYCATPQTAKKVS